MLGKPSSFWKIYVRVFTLDKVSLSSKVFLIQCLLKSWSVGQSVVVISHTPLVGWPVRPSLYKRVATSQVSWEWPTPKWSLSLWTSESLTRNRSDLWITRHPLERAVDSSAALPYVPLSHKFASVFGFGKNLRVSPGPWYSRWSFDMKAVPTTKSPNHSPNFLSFPLTSTFFLQFAPHWNFEKKKREEKREEKKKGKGEESVWRRKGERKDGSVSRSGSKKSKNQQNFKSSEIFSRHCTTFCNSFVLYWQKICVERRSEERDHARGRLYVEERIGEKRKVEVRRKVRKWEKRWSCGREGMDRWVELDLDLKQKWRVSVFILNKTLRIWITWSCSFFQQNPQIFRFSLIIAHHYFLLCRVFLSLTTSLPMRWRREQGEQVA